MSFRGGGEGAPGPPVMEVGRLQLNIDRSMALGLILGIGEG